MSDGGGPSSARSAGRSPSGRRGGALWSFCSPSSARHRVCAACGNAANAGRRPEFLGPARAHRAALGADDRRDPLPHHRRFSALRLPRPARHPGRLRHRPRAGDLRGAEGAVRHPGRGPSRRWSPASKDGTGNAIIAGFDLEKAPAEGLIASQAYLKIPGRFVVPQGQALRPRPAGAGRLRRRASAARAHAAYLAPLLSGPPRRLLHAPGRRARRAEGGQARRRLRRCARAFPSG